MPHKVNSDMCKAPIVCLSLSGRVQTYVRGIRKYSRNTVYAINGKYTGFLMDGGLRFDRVDLEDE